MKSLQLQLWLPLPLLHHPDEVTGDWQLPAACTSVSGSQAEQHSIADTESVYHTHFCSFTAYIRWGSHFTLHKLLMPQRLSKIPLLRAVGGKSSFGAGIVDPLQETLVPSDPPDKPGPHRDCLLCLLLRWAGLVQGSSTTSRGWLWTQH